MAKESVKARQRKREALVAKFAAKREALKQEVILTRCKNCPAMLRPCV